MERGDASDAERTALDFIREIKELEPVPAVADKLDQLARVLRRSKQQDDRGGNTKPRRQFEAFAGRFAIGPKFFEPMSEEDRRIWDEAGKDCG